MKLTIIVPVFNEARTILRAIEEAKKIDVEKEIIVIDNCSTDGTREILKGLKDSSIKVIFQDKNYGFGNTIKTGLSLTKGEYIFVQMSDLEYDYRHCLWMLEMAEEQNYDAVFGSRLKNNKENKLKIIWKRPEYIASFICTFLINTWYKKNFTDVLGTRFYRTKSVKQVPITTLGVGFEFEHISRMCKYGYKIGEVGVPYKPRQRRREKKIRPYHLFLALLVFFRVRYGEKCLKIKKY